MSVEYSIRRLLNASLFLSIFLLLPSLAEGSGTVKGTVYDKTTKGELPGANVVVKGTSVGAATSLVGVYIIRNAPAGQQTIAVSYLGYVSTTVTIDIPEGGTVNQDFYLVTTEIEGEEVVVTAQAKGQMQAINQQLASNKIVNVVSEAKIQELPDVNAAQAIARLPGVSTLESSGEANKVVIRGLAPQYNAVAIDGISLASTGSTQIGASSNPDITFRAAFQDRSVDLSMVTPYMIKSISVYKTLTPDLNANAVGGLVDMQLREAPSGFHTDVMWQSGYSNMSQTYGNYRFVGSASDRFFEDNLGVYVLGNAEQYDRNADNMNAAYGISRFFYSADSVNRVTVQNTTLLRHIETRKRYGGNVILDYTLPFGSIRSVNMFSRLNSKYEDYQTVLHYNDPSSGNVNFNYRAGDRNTDLAINTIEAAMDFELISLNLKAASNYSRNNEPNSALFSFLQSGGIQGPFPDNTVPEALVRTVNFRGPQETYLSTVNLLSADFKENDHVYKGDFKIPFSIESDFSGFIKFGGEYRYNHRKNEQGTPYARIDRTSPIQRAMVDSLMRYFPVTYDSSNGQFTGLNFTYPIDPDLLEPFLNNQFGSMMWVVRPDILNGMVSYISGESALNGVNGGGINPGGWFDGAFQHLANYYKYVERYYGAYLMSELNVGADLMVVGGARFEQDESLFEAFNMVDGRDPRTQLAYPVTVYPQDRYLLPMVQAKYNLADWLDIRYGYTQTLARPDYHQLTPHFTMNFSRNTVWGGNPRLTPAQAYNHDVIITLHSNDVGLLSIGGFYKEISNFTYYTTYKLRATAPAPGLDSLGTYTVGGVSPQNGADLNTYVNSPYTAFVRGVEVDFQTRFWYLPAPLNGVTLGINYTHIWSKTTYPWRQEQSIFIPPRTTITRFIDSTRTGRLIYQPNDVFNAYVGYDYMGFSARVSCVFQGNSVSNIGALPEQDGFTRDYFRVDASARQVLPWSGLQVFLDIYNINERMNTSAQTTIGGFTSQQHYGLTANLGVRFIL